MTDLDTPKLHAVTPESNRGWYADPHHLDRMLWWNGAEWKDPHRSLPESDNGGLHFLRFLVLAAVWYLALSVFIGLIAIPFALRATGRRARDTLMVLIPLWGAVVVVQTLWRLSARRMSWLPRTDLPSKPLFGPGILPTRLVSPGYVPGPPVYVTKGAARR
jgi:hypothetical protein